ncbi:MAG: efflux RND transporter permease subunit [Leptospiraceae bacterium]|nr:efflux RND transporter permease subunit [Leptospiraceae bacterium]MCP5496118.1 efflux RND transporter permease subunit [Leptospiraceae bacterium]
MEKVIEFLLTKKIATLFLVTLICILGLLAWNELDIEAYPDIGDIEVSVIAQSNGLPAEEMELQVTIPIERALNSVPGVMSKRSRTIFGLSVIRLTFVDSTDIYLARQLILEKLRSAELPRGVKPELGPMTPSIGEILRYVIESDGNISLTKIREYQEYVIIPQLLQAPGVIDISNFGGYIRQYQVILNPLQLEKYALSVKDIAEAISNNNKNTGGSYIRVGASQMNIRGKGRISNKKGIENIVIDNRQGVPILIKDIAHVELDARPPSGLLGYMDKTRNKSEDKGIEGIVLLRKFENPSKTIEGVYEKIRELNEEILPKSIRIIPLYDRTELVNLTLKTVSLTLLEGTIIVFVLLTLLLGSWRAAIISSLAIPFSLLFTFICMKLYNIPANLLSLGAIDFGLIVDAAIVMVEGIVRNLMYTKSKNTELKATILVSAKETQKQIFFSVGIIILALVPILTLQRVEGRMFSPMAWTLSFAILGSLLYAIMVVPLLSLFMFHSTVFTHESRVWKKVENLYLDWLKKLIRKSKVVVLSSTVVIVLGISAGFGLGTEFLPELDEGCVWVKVFLPAGISLQEASQYPIILRKELEKFDEVRSVITQLGRNDDGTDPYGPNRIEVLVQLVQPYSSWPVKKTKKELIKEIKRSLKKVLPGVTLNVTQPIIDNTTESATGSSADIAVMINGKNLDTLRKIAKESLAIVKIVKGATDASIEQENKQTQLVVAIKREDCARYGVNVEDINLILETAIGGMPVSSIYKNEKKFDIVVRFTLESRNTPDSIGKILIPTRTGRVPLSFVADIKLEEGETIIFRENSRRQLIVKTNIRERDSGSFAEEIKTKLKEKIKLPRGVYMSIGGQFENLGRAQKRLSYIVPLTIFLIFLVLVIFFKNKYSDALIVMANIPFAVIGGIFALYLRGMNFTISAGVGFVSLFGIAVMSGVLLLSYLNQLRSEGKQNLLKTILKGSLVQFRPRFLVMIIAIIGLLPAAMNTGIGSDVQRPMATVIVGGLFSSLILTMFLTSVIYYIVEKKKKYR